MRAASLFDEVVVAVSTNPTKTYRFSEDERVQMIRDQVSSISGIIVEPMGNGLLADYCARKGARAILKGLRNSQDFEFETPMASMNRHLTGVETVFILGDPEYQYVSSSLIKEVASLGGDITEFVPKSVAAKFTD